MTETAKLLKDFFENTPLYVPITLRTQQTAFSVRSYRLKEIQAECRICNESKPFHNRGSDDYVVYLASREMKKSLTLTFECVTCRKDSKRFWLKIEHIEEIITLQKIGQDPQKELSRSKALSKFFKADKEEYNKAVISIANGYGVAAFAYMRRIVENNILGLLEQIQEGVDKDSEIAKSINELKTTSPMSDRIKIANNALPDYLKPEGFNPLGQIYGLLSDGVHSLPDKECLAKAENIQACLEFLISELAAHKQNKEEFKKRLAALRK